MSMRRRDFLKAAAAGVIYGCSRSEEPKGEDYFEDRMETMHIPGLTGCVKRNGEMVREIAYGFSDLDEKTPIGLDTIQNIASISKTFAATALMQLWEQGEFRLDDDVNALLPYTVNPKAAVTFRQLLTHTSSIADGTSYSRNYVCGDPDISLSEWLEEYFTPGGRFYDENENFHPWGPGERYTYCNVAYGLLGHLIEVMSGERFADYCQSHIFEPLDMPETSWFLADVDTAKHAIPYTWVEQGEARGPTWGGEPLGAIGATAEADGYLANCLYNHPNYPDGFLRTSVRQLALYMNAYLRGGEPILKKETVDTMLKVHSEEIWGLCWYVRDVGGLPFWGHGGADPGVNTRIDFNRETGVGSILFANTFMDDAAAEMRDLNAHLVRTSS